MRWLAVWIGLGVGASVQAESVQLKYSPACILQAVAVHRKVTLDRAKPLPKIYLSSQTALEDFQDAVELQWGERPLVFTNVYAATPNAIFLVNDSSNLINGRTLDDVLAHELTHYLQVAYMGADPKMSTDGDETEATTVQHWFRETYMETNKSPCAEMMAGI